MNIIFTDHALDRMPERGVTEAEVIKTLLEYDSTYPAKQNRTKFQKAFANKLVIVTVVQEADAWVVITVVANPT